MTILDYKELKRQFDKEEAWGICTSLDVKECDHDKITIESHLRKYVDTLCKLIKMKKHGACQIVHFGDDDKVAGYSMTQLIETSLISGHFANLTNNAYIDIFSCKFYNPYLAADFTKEFFGGKSIMINVTLRY